jgi:hypothetical protein
VTKNQAKILKVLDSGPRSYTELQDRSGVPESSFSRNLGQLVESGQIVNDDGKYRHARTPSGTNNLTSEDSGGEHTAESEGSSEGLTPTDSDSDGGVDERDVPETLRKAVFRIPERETTRAGALNATITLPDGTTETISHAEHQRRKGYPGVMP